MINNSNFKHVSMTIRDGLRQKSSEEGCQNYVQITKTFFKYVVWVNKNDFICSEIK